MSNVAASYRTELCVRTERKVAPNNSSATVTESEQFALSRTRIVSVETRKATIHGTKAGLNFAGFANLGKTLENELRTMYSLTRHATITRTKTVSFQIPPHTVIEIDLTWKVVRDGGIGHFLSSGGLSLDIPFEVDVDLEIAWKTRNAGGEA